MPEKIYIDSQTIHILYKVLVSHITQNYDVVVGILNGGESPARYIAEHLYLPLKFVTIQTRDNNTINTGDFIADDYIDKKILVVDDILDSGKTLETFRYNLAPINKYVDFATVFYKTDGKTQPMSRHYYACVVPQSLWVHFPWEI